MKLKQIILLFCLSLSFILISCKDNNSCACEMNGKIPDSYLPLSVGSWWKYNGKNDLTLTVYDSSLIAGKVHYYCSNSLFQNCEFVIEDNKNTVNFYTFNAFGLFDTYIDNVMLNILKTGDSTSWSQTFIKNNTIIRYEYRITEKIKEKTVGTKNYKDIVCIESSRYALSSDKKSARLQSRNNYYFARKVGLIESYNADSTLHYQLSDYFIAPTN